MSSPLAAGSFGVLGGLIVDQRRVGHGTLFKTRRPNTKGHAMRVFTIKEEELSHR